LLTLVVIHSGVPHRSTITVQHSLSQAFTVCPLDAYYPCRSHLAAEKFNTAHPYVYPHYNMISRCCPRTMIQIHLSQRLLITTERWPTYSVHNAWCSNHAPR